MRGRKLLALLALTIPLAAGLTACGGDETSDEPYHLTVNGEDRGMVSDDSDPGETGGAHETATPTDFGDEAAQAAVADLCGKLDRQDVATLLGLPETKVEQQVSEPQSDLEKAHAYCLFDAPDANNGSVAGEDGQTFLSVSVKGPAVAPATGSAGGVVKFGDGSTGYYSDTTLLVTPTGSPYEFTFDVVLPYDATTASGLDYDTTELWRTKAAEAAGGALN